jgi:adenylate cyclase
VPRRRLRRQFWWAAGSGAVVALACYLLPGFASLVATLEYRTLDWRFQLRGREPPSPQLVIVAIDEASLAAVGRWPWPRQTMARLLEAIEAARPALVALDILFAEASARQADAQLAAAVRRYGNVFLPLFITTARPPKQLFSLPALAAWQRVKLPPGSDPSGELGLFRPRGLTAPLAEIAAAAAGLGIVDLVGSGDGVYRDIALLSATDEGLVPSMALALAAAWRRIAPHELVVEPGKYLLLGPHAFPLDSYGLTLVNYAGPSGTYPRVSAVAVLGRDPGALAQLQGRIVLVGATAAGLYDLRPTPFDANYCGVEALADATGSVVEGKSLWALGETKALALALLLVVAVSAQIGWVAGSAGWIAALLLILGYAGLAVGAFVYGRVVMPLFPPMASCLAALLAGLAVRLASQEQEHRRILEVFSYFVPPEIAEHLVEADLEAATRGQRRLVTVLFADIRHSTAYALRQPPEELVQALNRFFTETHAVVWRHGGTLDKFLGDGLLAFFNAPLEQPDHALRAVRTALDTIAMVHQSQDLWRFYGLERLQLVIGLSTGEAVVSFVGSSRRMQYTVIGPPVHRAARLQELAKDLDVQILADEATYQAVAEWVVARDLGPHRLRGFDQPVRVYEIVAARHPRGGGPDNA